MNPLPRHGWATAIWVALAAWMTDGQAEATNWLEARTGQSIAGTLDLSGEGWLLAVDGGLAVPLSEGMTWQTTGRLLVAAIQDGQPPRWFRVKVSGSAAVPGTRSQQLRLDTEAPRATIATSGPRVDTDRGPLLAPSAQLNINAEDPAGVARTWLRVDDTEFGEPTVAALGQGTHRAVAFAEDRAGNAGAGAELAFVVDAQGPEIEWSVLNENLGTGGTPYFQPPVQVRVEATDPAGVSRLEADGRTLDTGAVVETDQQSLAITAVDALGNRSSQVAGWDFDRSGPKVELLLGGVPQAPVEVIRIPADEILVPRVADAESGVASSQYRINGGRWKPLPEAIRFVDRGWYQVEIRAGDRVGNLSTELWDVRTGKPRSLRPRGDGGAP